MDDLLKSVETTEIGGEMALNLIQLAALGGFRLTKWKSADPAVLENIPEEDRARLIKEFTIERHLPSERALGVDWSLETDTLGYHPKLSLEVLTTRRGVLSMIAGTYDLIGYAGPFILRAKQLIQWLCKRGLDWDQPMDSPIWLSGPAFLRREECHWPLMPEDLKNAQLGSDPKVKLEASCLVTTTGAAEMSILERFSSLELLVRKVAWLRRFPYNVRVKQKGLPLELGPNLSVAELENSKSTIFKAVQAESFALELTKIGDTPSTPANTRNLPLTSKIARLNPFLAEDGLLRVGGQIEQEPDGI
ncbi:uncharacterized protein LOC135220927 [Macrobrachium nipponense]|uniref:uncharacterized protein LOC135220927 n=1 Tax=Macrobrachium nipponense TaxID=159736 RepID=UPI0030C82D46